MALTLTHVTGPYAFGDRWQVVYKAQFGASYPTGGESLRPSLLGGVNTDTEFNFEVDSVGGWGCVYNYSTQKLQLFSSTATTSTEVTNATNVSGPTFRIVLTSKNLG